MGDPYTVRFEQDRALRNAARDLVQQDVGFIRGDNARRSATERMADRAKARASNLAEEASDFATSNSGAIAAGVALAGAAIALTLFRRPLIDTLREWVGIEFDPEQGPPPPHSNIEQDF